MIAVQNPSAPHFEHAIAEAAASLSGEDRGLLNALLQDPPLPLAALAHHLQTDLLGLAQRILSPDFQTALTAIKAAAESIAQVRALLYGPEAISTLAAVSTQANPNQAERRRAATTLLRVTHR